MKVLTLKQMLEMPEGTLFGKVPLGVYELMIKGANHPDGDFWMQSLTQGTGEFYDEALGYDAKGNELDPKNITGNSFGLNTACQERDEEFDETDLYVVYEPEDHKKVVIRLIQALGKTGNVDGGLVSLITDTLSMAGRVIPVNSSEKAKIETLTQHIYESWSNQPGYVTWGHRGNSLKQEAKRVFEKYLEEAQLDEHGNPFSRRDHSWANHSTKFRQDNYSIHDHLKEVTFTDDRYVEK